MHKHNNIPSIINFQSSVFIHSRIPYIQPYFVLNSSPVRTIYYRLIADRNHNHPIKSSNPNPPRFFHFTQTILISFISTKPYILNPIHISFPHSIASSYSIIFKSSLISSFFILRLTRINFLNRIIRNNQSIRKFHI